jgi:hypothetical protein
VVPDQASLAPFMGDSPLIAFDLDDEFESFMRKACPLVRETSIQYKESRRVFVSGCAAMYQHLLNEVTTLPEAEAHKELEQISVQLEQFFHKRLGFSD